MKKIYIFLTVIGSFAIAQENTGINTTNPQATLEVASKTDNTTNDVEGLLIPRVSKQKALLMAANSPEESTMIYVNDLTDFVDPADGTEITVVNIMRNGYYYWDGTTWSPIVYDRIQNADKTLVYANDDFINREISYPDGSSGVVDFDDVPTEDPNFTNDPSLEENENFLYVTPSGSIYIWSPSEGKYINAETDIAGNSLFYKTATLEDAKATKTKDIWRTGKIGVGIKNPISQVHARSTISGIASDYIKITVDNTKGDDKINDRVFNTLVEAINYANTIVNNGTISIYLANSSSVILPDVRIMRNMRILGSTTQNILNIDGLIRVAKGVSFGIVEGYDLTVNQNAPVAFRLQGRNTISLGGYSGIKYNFSSPGQSLLSMTYHSSVSNDEVNLAMSRVDFTGLQNQDLAWLRSEPTDTGSVNLSYWSMVLPEGIDSRNVHSIKQGNAAWKNLLGTYLAFSGYDANNNFIPIERMRIQEDGNVKVNSLEGVDDRFVIADTDGVLKTEGIADMFAANSEWVYDPATERINLKRSGVGTFANNIYYNSKTGGKYQYNADREVKLVSFLRNSQSTQLQEYIKDFENVSAEDFIFTYSEDLPNYNDARGFTRKYFQNDNILNIGIDDSDSYMAEVVQITADNPSSILAINFDKAAYLNGSGSIKYVTGKGDTFISNAQSVERTLYSNSSESNISTSGSIAVHANMRSSTFMESTSGATIGSSQSILLNHSPNPESKVVDNSLIKKLHGVYNRVINSSQNAGSGDYIVGAQHFVTQDSKTYYPFMAGLRISSIITDEAQPAGKNYGLIIESIDGADVNNYAIYTKAGLNSFGDSIEVRQGHVKVEDGVILTEKTGTGVAVGGACTELGKIVFQDDNFYGCKSTGWVLFNN